MPEVAFENDQVVIKYQRGSGKRIRRFDLGLTYLGDSFVAFTLVAEEGAGGVWRALRAEIDSDDTTADPDDAANDLADVRWHIFPSRERGRKLPPVVTVWEEKGLILAACLSDRYAGRRAPFAEQEKWFENPAGSERHFCWWPDRDAWQNAKEAAQQRSVLPIADTTFSFYPFGEWIQRTDVRSEIEEYKAELEDMEDDPETRASALAEIVAEDYNRYVRRTRTMLWYYHKKNISAKVVAGNVRRAEAYFAEKSLDSHDPSAWAAATFAFEPMPDFLIEDLGSCGPLGVAISGQKLKAALSLVSHWPGMSPVPDAVGAAVYAGARHVAGLAAWLNPSAGWDVAEKATEALLEELSRRGVEQIILVGDIQSFKACSCCGRLTFPVPDDWLKPEPARVQKTGRNEPCPCGSGLKHKRCCGAGG